MVTSHDIFTRCPLHAPLPSKGITRAASITKRVAPIFAPMPNYQKRAQTDGSNLNDPAVLCQRELQSQDNFKMRLLG